MTRRIAIQMVAAAGLFGETVAAPLQLGADGTAEVSGTVTANELRFYSFAGKKGQAVTVELTAARASWAVVRVFPAAGGEDVASNFISGDTKLEGTLAADGEYRVQMGIRRAEARRGGRVAYQLRVTVRGAGGK